MIEGLTITGAAMTLEARTRVLETALDAGYTHGIGYWAEVVKIKYYEHDKPESGIGALCLHDHEGGGVPDLTILGSNNAIKTPKCPHGQLWLNGDHIQRAVERMLMDPKGTDSEGWTDALMTYDAEDGPLADAIVQVACFGKVIYG